MGRGTGRERQQRDGEGAWACCFDADCGWPVSSRSKAFAFELTLLYYKCYSLYVCCACVTFGFQERERTTKSLHRSICLTQNPRHTLGIACCPSTLTEPGLAQKEAQVRHTCYNARDRVRRSSGGWDAKKRCRRRRAARSRLKAPQRECRRLCCAESRPDSSSSTTLSPHSHTHTHSVKE